MQEPAETTLTDQDDSTENPCVEQPKGPADEVNIDHVLDLLVLPKSAAPSEGASSEPDSRKDSPIEHEWVTPPVCL